jgi:hypothetical protein
MLKTVLTYLAVSVALGAAACSPKPAAEGAKPELAEKVSPNTYRNGAVGLTVTAPEGWYVADSAFTEKLMDVGKQVSTSSMDAREKAQVDASLARSANIFTFFQHPPGPAMEANAGIMALTENIGAMPGITKGRDYFFHARKVLQQAGVPTKIAEGYSSRKIGGQEFDRMDVLMGAPEIAVSQRYFAARHNDYVMVIIQSYKSDEELAALDKVLDSIKLDW